MVGIARIWGKLFNICKGRKLTVYLRIVGITPKVRGAFLVKYITSVTKKYKNGRLKSF